MAVKKKVDGEVEETGPVNMWDWYRLDCRLLEPMLGTWSKDPDVLTRHVLDTERRQSDEVVPEPTSEDIDLRGSTTFPIDNEGRPVLLDYQVKGTIKEAGNTVKGLLKVANLRSHINDELFVYPRMVVLAEKIDGDLERPLRAMTAKGPRVTVVRSDKIEPLDAEGNAREWSWTVKIMRGSVVNSKRVLDTIGEYMAEKGFLQWRNAGYGRVYATFTKIDKPEGMR